MHKPTAHTSEYLYERHEERDREAGKHLNHRYQTMNSFSSRTRTSFMLESDRYASTSQPADRSTAAKSNIADSPAEVGACVLGRDTSDTKQTMNCNFSG
jgi:hypothetical protein